MARPISRQPPSPLDASWQPMVGGRVGAWIDRFGLNETRIGEHPHDPERLVAWKIRRPGSDLLVRVANTFFAAAGSPLRLWKTRAQWQRREVRDFTRLNPGWQAGAEGARAVWAELVPGDDLVELLRRGELTAGVMQAAARALRQAHRGRCPEFGDAWSHGDPHLGNLIYDASTDRARLIDFEVYHRRPWPAADRHANDLLVLLQDLCGRTGRRPWLELAAAFLAEYGDGAVIAALVRQLAWPRGLARVWWSIRTSYLPGPELEARLASLRASLANEPALLSSGASS